MTNFFTSVSDFISLGWDMLMNSIRSIITMFTVLGSAMTIHNTIIGLMPSILAASAMIVTAAAVLKFVIGRIGGGS